MSVEFITLQPDADNDAEPYDADATYIDLTNTRLTAIPPNLPSTADTVVLRQNDISTPDNLSTLTNLTNLDLYLNSISAILADALPPSLTTLDLSFNQVRSISDLHLASLPSLAELYLINNKISIIDGLDQAKSLKLLELGANRLRSLAGISTVSHLTSLYIGKNKITELPPDMLRMTHLTTLSIQSNRLLQLDNLQQCTALTELYVSHNGLSQLHTSLHNLTKLRVLDVSGNQLIDLNGLEHCTALQEIWCNDNQIADWTSIEQYSSILTQLNTVYLERNPVQQLQSTDEYRVKVKQLFPQMEQLDADLY